MRYDWVRKLSTFTTETDNSVVQTYDILNINWNDFSFPTGYVEYVVSSTDAERPWMIAFKFYGSAIYEDFVFLVNHIKNPLALRPGLVLKMPRLEDIKAFINGIKQ